VNRRGFSAWGEDKNTRDGKSRGESAGIPSYGWAGINISAENYWENRKDESHSKELHPKTQPEFQEKENGSQENHRR